MTSVNPFGRSPHTIASIPNDVSLERVMIDRELRWMLERAGYDLHGIAERLIAHGYYLDPSGTEVKAAWEEVGDNVFELVQEGLRPPVMSSAALIGTACYHGDSLYVRELLPQTLCVSMVGRRLGDVVSTGMSRLDDGPILEAIAPVENYWPPIAATRFVFAPDLVELGCV